MSVKHYCFLSYGIWGNNPTHIRTRQLGNEMIRRRIRVTYVVDDYPENHSGLGVHADAHVAYVSRPRSIRQIPARRRILRQLAPDFVHVKDFNFRSAAALIGQPALRVVTDWDEPNLFKPMSPV